MTSEEKKLQQHFDRFDGLVEVPETASWKAAAIHCVTRLKCANLAIVSIVAVAALVAYKGLPPTTTAEALGAIAILGVFGKVRER